MSNRRTVGCGVVDWDWVQRHYCPLVTLRGTTYAWLGLDGWCRVVDKL